MKEVIDIGTGAVEVAGAGAILRSSAIGSCIVIAAYDSSKKVGAIAHSMLPGRAPKDAGGKRTRYAADAIDEMINKMTRTGANQCDLEVCLVGAGNVLKKQDDTICKDNIESTTELLGKKHIPIRAAALGGTERKGISLDVGSGSIFYTEGDGKEKLLWKS
jgi:chemotaxis protein CheD